MDRFKVTNVYGETEIDIDPDGEWVLYDDVPKWIKCSEKMPDEMIPVLILTDYGKMDVCRFCDGLWINYMRPQHSDGSVTHWMPLPEPPRLTP